MNRLHPDDPLLGMTLGGCRIDAVLGRGGMGTVYRGFHIALDKAVAVKLLAPHLAVDPSFVQRFLHEARAAARIEHPNVVQILNVGEEHEQHFIVMQYVEGQNLQDVLERHGRIDVKRATKIAREVAAGLQALHKEGIVHRDIKPANILLPRDGGIKITDFGLARNLRQGPRPGMTQPGTFMGTPEFVAPEQVLGSVVDGRADLYSLGVTYYLTLSGELPFPLRNAPDPQALHGEAEPPALDSIVPGIDAKVVGVVKRLLRKEPKDRFQEASALVSELEAILNGGVAGKVAAAEAPVPEIAVKGRRIPPAAAAPRPAEDEVPVISAGPKKRLVDQGPIVPREIVRSDLPKAPPPPTPAVRPPPPAPPPAQDETALIPPSPAPAPPSRDEARPGAPPADKGEPARPAAALNLGGTPAPKTVKVVVDGSTLAREGTFWVLFVAGCGLLFSAGALGSSHGSGNLLSDLPRLLFEEEGFLLRAGLAGAALIAMIVALVLERPRLEQLRAPAVAVVLLLVGGLSFYVAGVVGPAAAGTDPLIVRVLRGTLQSWIDPGTAAVAALWGAAAGLCLGAGRQAKGAGRFVGTLLVLGALAAAMVAASGEASRDMVEKLKADQRRLIPAAVAIVAALVGLFLAFGERKTTAAKTVGVLLVGAAVAAFFYAGLPGPAAAEALTSRLTELGRSAAAHSGALTLSAVAGWWGGWLLYP